MLESIVKYAGQEGSGESRQWDQMMESQVAQFFKSGTKSIY